jgi:hypothetical protein
MTNETIRIRATAQTRGGTITKPRAGAEAHLAAQGAGGRGDLVCWWPWRLAGFGILSRRSCQQGAGRAHHELAAPTVIAAPPQTGRAVTALCCPAT